MNSLAIAVIVRDLRSESEERKCGRCAKRFAEDSCALAQTALHSVARPRFVFSCATTAFPPYTSRSFLCSSSTLRLRLRLSSLLFSSTRFVEETVVPRGVFMQMGRPLLSSTMCSLSCVIIEILWTAHPPHAHAHAGIRAHAHTFSTSSSHKAAL